MTVKIKDELPWESHFLIENIEVIDEQNSVTFKGKFKPLNEFEATLLFPIKTDIREILIDE